MAKPEWGAKHTCNSCSKIFYDMLRNPIVCPSCGKTHVPVVILKPGRTISKKSAMVRVVKPMVEESEEKKNKLLDDEAILKEEEPDRDDDDDENGDLGVVVSKSSDSEGLS